MYWFKVDKMGCGGCGKSVTRAVLSIEPDAWAELDLRAELVTVSGTTGLGDCIAQAISAGGFSADRA